MPPNPPAWRRYLRFWGSNPRVDVDDELRFHLEMRIADYVARGMSPDEARRVAERRFGNAHAARNECLDIHVDHERSRRRARFVDGLRQDLVFALRVLRRQPLPAAAAIVCLAVGIGATTAMFSVANTLLVRPLPFPNGDRLVWISSLTGGRSGAGVSSLPDYLDLRARQRSFTEVAVARYQDYTWRRDVPIRVTGSVATASLFRTTGARAEAGRLFTDDDNQPGAAKVAVVSRGFADRWLGGPSAAIDRTLDLGGSPYRVVGVLPDAWRYPDRAEIWTPLVKDEWSAGRGNRHLRMLAALKPSTDLAGAVRDLDAVAQTLRRDFMEDSVDKLAFGVQPLRDRYVAGSKTALLALSVASLLVLLVGCANVAGLQLARATTRVREIALRSAIGAERGRVLRQLLTENVVLALVGGTAGCLLAWWGTRLLGRAVADSAPPWMVFALDPWALAFTTALSMTAGVVCGLTPAFRLAGLDPATALRGGRAGGGRGRLQRTFVAVELAMSMVLLVGAGLTIQSVVRLAHVPLGFDPAGVLTFRVELQGARYDSAVYRAAVIAELDQRIRAIPGVRASGAVTRAPLTGCCSEFGTTIEGREYAGLMVAGNMVTPGYLNAMRVPLLAGRFITAQDTRTSQRVVIINETFAKRFWPAGDALGKRIDTGGGWATIVGIVGDIKQNGLMDGPQPQFYAPHAQDPWETMTYVVRASGEEVTGLMTAIRRAFKELDPHQPIYGVVRMESMMEGQLASDRTLGRMLVAFAIIALLLASAGVYGAMSFLVSQRTHELGLRMALGADRSRVAGLVARQAVIMTAGGLGIGTVGAWLAARALAHNLYGVRADDPMLYLIGLGTLGLTAMLATLSPTRRAIDVDPMVALRSE